MDSIIPELKGYSTLAVDRDSGERIVPEVKKGDVVLYGKYAGTEVTVQGKDYLILRESDILAIL